MIEQYDAIIIGAGEAGTQVESMVVPTGKKVALIYNGVYGATCLNYGCVPSKFMIARARVAQTVRDAGRYHVSAAAPHVDLAAIVKEKDAMLAKERGAMLAEAKAAQNLTLIKGHARFSGDHQLTVGERILHAPLIFLATGQRPALPQLEGLDTVTFYTNETVMNLHSLPDHLLVLGGGYIACEEKMKESST